MSFLSDHLLTIIVFLPLVGALIAMSFPASEHSGVRGFALAVSIIDLALAVWMWIRFDAANPGLQLTEHVEWIPTYGIKYSLGVDGIALLLVVLTTFLAPIVILNSYSSVTTRAREYVVCMLFLQTGMLGAFLATDLFLFYVFWELMLIPMYFLIGIWGSKNRVYAALKFFLYTMAGSLLMLVAIVFTVLAVRDMGGISFAWADVSARLAQKSLGGAELWLFLAFAVAFAIKVPAFPFHTWLPDAHVQAPTGGSVILAGVLLKLGTFGFLRYAFWLFPKAAAEMLPAIGLIAVIGIVYGALVAMVQQDLKRLVAYSSVSHLGFVMLGLAAMTITGITGGVIQMVNHGISTAALFLLVGVIYERRHTRMISDFGGLAKVMPWYCFVWVIMAMSSIGVPGLNGFVGEFLVLVGTFESTGMTISTATGDVATAGIVAVGLVALVAVVLLAYHLLVRVSDDVAGRGTKIAAIAGAGMGALVIAAPPVGGFEGGLLVRPLYAASGVTGEFGEVFAALAVVAATGVIFAAVYLLWATQRVFFGPLRHPENQDLKDLSSREVLFLAPLVIAAVVMGLYPKPFLDVIEPTVATYATKVRVRAGLPALAHGPALSPAPAVADPVIGQPPRVVPPRPQIAPGPRGAPVPMGVDPRLRQVAPVPSRLGRGGRPPIPQPRVLPYRQRLIEGAPPSPAQPQGEKP